MSDFTSILEELELLKENSPMGFAVAHHIRLTTPSFLFQNYSQDWISYYSENGLVMSDPTVLWGFENEGTVAWSQLADFDSNNMLSKAAEFGLVFGVTWSHESDGSKSIGSFARSDREFDQTETDLLVGSFTKLHDLTAGLNPIKETGITAIQNQGFIVSQTIK